MLGQSFPSDDQPLLEVRATLAPLFQGVIVFRNFALDSEFSTCVMFGRHGHCTVKQFRAVQTPVISPPAPAVKTPAPARTF